MQLKNITGYSCHHVLDPAWYFWAWVPFHSRASASWAPLALPQGGFACAWGPEVRCPVARPMQTGSTRALMLPFPQNCPLAWPEVMHGDSLVFLFVSRWPGLLVHLRLCLALSPSRPSTGGLLTQPLCVLLCLGPLLHMAFSYSADVS